MNKEKRINILLRKTSDSMGKRFDHSSLNATERRFFLKHPDQVREVLKGERSHVRASRIVLKMLTLDLSLDDFDEVYEFLKTQELKFRYKKLNIIIINRGFINNGIKEYKN